MTNGLLYKISLLKEIKKNWINYLTCSLSYCKTLPLQPARCFGRKWRWRSWTWCWSWTTEFATVRWKTDWPFQFDSFQTKLKTKRQSSFARTRVETEKVVKTKSQNSCLVKSSEWRCKKLNIGRQTDRPSSMCALQKNGNNAFWVIVTAFVAV